MKRRNFIKGLLALPVTLAVVDATLAAKAFFGPKPDLAKLVEKQAPITEWQPNTAYNVGDRIVSSTGKVWTVSGAGVSGNTEVLVHDHHDGRRGFVADSLLGSISIRHQGDIVRAVVDPAGADHDRLRAPSVL